MSTPFPHWPEQRRIRFLRLRQVGPLLWIGGAMSPAPGAFMRPDLVPVWGAVVDLAGVSRHPEAGYESPIPLLVLPFDDGDPVPGEILDRVRDVVRGASHPVLLHCAEGLSRSASVAYAMLRLGGVGHEDALHRVTFGGERGYPVRETLESARAWAEGA